jgi:hypothetical protein
MIINNFIIRPFSLDVFLMRMFVTNFSVDKSYINNYFIQMDFKIVKKIVLNLLEEKEYILLAACILKDISEDHIINTLETILFYFIGKGLTIDNKKIINEFKIILKVDWFYTRIKLLSKIMNLYVLLNRQILGKNVYVHVDAEEVTMYETIHSDLNEKKDGTKQTILPAYKILPLAALYPIDAYNYLSLFKLNRENYDIQKAYYDNWLYHASFAPIWKERILKYDAKKFSISSSRLVRR